MNSIASKRNLPRNSQQSKWPQLKYHPVQSGLWYSPERFAYIPCGRQSGKTELAMRRLVRYLPIKREWTDPRYVYSGPTYRQVKRVAWRRLLSLIPRSWIADISVSELTIMTIFGSELALIGLDKPERIEGVMLDGIVIDEYCDIKPGTFDLSVLPTLTWRSGWCWFTGVPKRFGVGATEYRERYEAAVRGELPNSAGFTWPSSDIVPADYLEYARKTMDERDFKEQFEASWLSASGGIFHAFDREYNVRPCTYNPAKAILVGSDFNVNPMVWVLCHVREDGQTLEVFDELFLRNTNTPTTLDVLVKRYSGHKGGFEFYGDATGRGRRTAARETDYRLIEQDQRLKAMGRTLHYLRSNPPQADRFAVTNAHICNGEGSMHLFVDPRCSHLITDLETRSFRPGTREAADSGDEGHPTDALGYLLYKKFPLRVQLPGGNDIIITKGRRV